MLCSIANIYPDENGKFHVFQIETEGNEIHTQVLAPLNENGNPNFAEKEPLLYVNGVALIYQVHYNLDTWDDNGTLKVKILIDSSNHPNLKPNDYVLFWLRSKLEMTDIQFTPGQRISSYKLSEIFKKVLQRLEELQSAGFLFVSNTLFKKMATGIQSIAEPIVEQEAREAMNDYVENTLKPDITQFLNLADELNTTSLYIDGGDLDYGYVNGDIRLNIDAGDLDI